MNKRFVVLVGWACLSRDAPVSFGAVGRRGSLAQAPGMSFEHDNR